MGKSMATNEEFVRAWASSNTLKEISDKIGVAETSIVQRGHRLRAKGVKLPELKGLDVNGLNEIIAEYQNPELLESEEKL